MENELDPDGLYHHFIDEVSFRFYSSEEIKKLSVKEITNPETFDLLTQAVLGGLYDPALGPTNNTDVCFTCGQGYVHCPGHMGYIELPFPVFNPVFFMKLYRILKSTCFYCHRITADMVSSHLFINQCLLLEAGNVSAAASLPDICGVADEGGETTKEETVNDKIKLIQEFTEKALQDTSNENVVLVKNVEAVRQEIVESFIKHKLKISGKCPYCEDPIQNVRQERKTKLIMITRGSKYSSEMQKKPADVNISDDEDMEDENGEPKRKRQKMNIKQGRKTVSGEVNLLTPLTVRDHLTKVWKKDSTLMKRIYPVLGFSQYENPVDMFFVERVVVPASRFRPTAKLGDLITNHPHSVNLSRVLKTSTLIREILWELEKAAASTSKEVEENYSTTIMMAPGKTLVDKLNLGLERLQTQVNVVTDSELDKLAKEYYPGIRQILEKKEGLFRKNMMGKRVNFAARSVISPDPNLNTNEIGIPLVFAEKLTFPQPVTPWNVQELRQAVINGPENHPGAFKIVTEDGQNILLDKKNKKNRMAIAKELLTPASHAKPSKNIKGTKIVYRHLKNGDVLLINRQPTLHRPSIQAHKARVLPGEKTLRLHYANCKAYNADFDGDEMNAHFPQNEVARAEGYHIALTDYHYLVPKDGTPLAGLIQDHMVSGVSLTIRGRFFTKADYCRLVYSALIDKVGKICLLPPSILKPAKLWSGKQVLSTLVLNVIPEGCVPLCLTGKAKVPEKSWINSDLGRVKSSAIPHMGESDVVIRHGELLVGVLDKGHYGPTPFGLIHSCYELYGGPVAGRLLTCFGRLFMNFLQWRGFSLGVEDILVTDKANKERKEIIEKSKTVGRDAAIKALDLPKTCSNEELLAAQRKAHYEHDQVQMQELDLAMRGETNDIQNNIVNACMPYGLEKLFPKNNLQLMVVSGAKGSMVNCMQISCLLGQIELEGKRPPLMASGRTLPSFLSYDLTPRAGGFVTGRFLTGIRQQEYFFHCMAGREGLVDTAVKTSRSGYLQRCLIKHLEGLKVNYDLTVRDSDNSIIQFKYGEDSLDISRVAYLNPKQFPFLLENHSVVRNYSHPSHESDKKVRKAMKKIKKWQGKNENFSYEGSGKIRRSGFLRFCQDVGDSIPEEGQDVAVPGRDVQAVQLCKLWRELSDKKRQKYIQKYGRCPDPVLSKYSLYSTAVLPEKFSNILDSYVKGNPDIERKGMTGSQFQDLIERKVKQCVVEPGEAVGLLCAQSIGEPSTQMTLNTFHFAGRGEMNVTLGIPRLREILMVGSKEIKTPAMDIPVLPGAENKNKAKRLQKKFTKVYLSQVLQNIQVTEWMSVIGRNRHSRKRMFKVRFNFLPKTAYKDRFIVTPNQILTYMERAYIKRIDAVIRQKLKIMSSSKLLSHGTRVSAVHADTATEEEEFKETSVKTVTDVNDEDSDDGDDDADDKGNSASKKEKKKHEEEHEYEDSEEEDEENRQNASDQEDVEMDDQGEEYGDLEENLIIDKEQKDNNRDARINAVLQLASSVEAYDYDGKKKQWCEVTLSFPIFDSKIDIASVLEMDVKKAVVHEVPGLSGCFLGEQKGANGSELHLKTEGINIFEINNYINILDVNRLYCNSIHAVANTFGIEAANKVIIKEIQMVFGAYGIEVDYRHLSLLADYMTFEGLYKPFSRRSANTNPSPLQKMSFETTMQFLVEATINGHKDSLTSPSSEIILGKNLSCGTGSFDLFNPIKL